MLLTTSAPCGPWVEQDLGPYHRDEQPPRRDVVEDRDGAPLQLGIRLAHDGDAPLAGATVEIWQCDALGRYSGFPPPDDSAVVSAGTAPRGEYLPDQTFLRGRQVCDSTGMVEFHTIYPGWYPGRTVHIHVMVHVDGHSLISQLYFPDEVSDAVLSSTPYALRHRRDTINSTDEIFAAAANPALLDVTTTGDGYRATICLALPSGGAVS